MIMRHHSSTTAPLTPVELVIITPARNEADRLPGLARCLLAQTRLPRRWVIVDDGSTDDTAKVAFALAKSHDWISVIQCSDRGTRKLGGGVVDTFNVGLESVDLDWDFVAKVDADLTFGPRYIERLLEHFAKDPLLGSASGKVFRPEDGQLVEEFMIDDMVAGQWKCWRRACFEEIGGLVPEIMWDGIDFHQARRMGWRTKSIPEGDLRIFHHRLMGSSDRSIYRGRVRLGAGQWFMGTHPLYLIASAIFRMHERPRVLGGICMLWGYFTSAVRRRPRYGDIDFRRDLRRWQLDRLRALATRGQVRG
ncbi:MAG: biofilm PGA synthesis N-glycosyltransferase PgaC [Planctomycetota bacterium]|jgi:biofilm PGA synthesis N-glycosyltransferase PgaC